MGAMLIAFLVEDHGIAHHAAKGLLVDHAGVGGGIEQRLAANFVT